MATRHRFRVEEYKRAYRRPKGGFYRSVRLHTPKEPVSPLAFPEASLPWSP
ncbi:hypothetical protein [Thermus sp.]|uniref:hypothetical protein n=1 Tax=Thermus sp. TaxID=275 RepID=UPI00307F71A6